MLTRSIIGACRVSRKAALTLVRTCGNSLKVLPSKVTESHPRIAGVIGPASCRSPERRPALTALQSSAMQNILSARSTILEQIGWAAEQGMVPDGLPRRLLASHEAELTEHRRLLAEDWLKLRSGLSHLAALFPLPAPEPEPSVEPRRRDFQPLGSLLAQRPKNLLS